MSWLITVAHTHLYSTPLLLQVQYLIQLVNQSFKSAPSSQNQFNSASWQENRRGFIIIEAVRSGSSSLGIQQKTFFWFNKGILGSDATASNISVMFITYLTVYITFPALKRTYTPVVSPERFSYAQCEQKMAWRVAVMHENAGLH